MAVRTWEQVTGVALGCPWTLGTEGPAAGPLQSTGLERATLGKQPRRTWVPGTENSGLKPKPPRRFQGLSEQAKGCQPHVLAPSCQLDDVPAVSSSPGLCVVRGLAGLFLLSSLESSQPSEQMHVASPDLPSGSTASSRTFLP